MRRLLPLLVLLLVAESQSCRSGQPERSLSSRQLEEMIRRRQGLVLVDVRSPEEYRAGHIPTARNIPLLRLLDRPRRTPRGNPLVLYCLTGLRSGQALLALRRAGYTNCHNFGGIARWTGKRTTGEVPGWLD